MLERVALVRIHKARLEEIHKLVKHPKKEHVWSMAWGRCGNKGIPALDAEYAKIARLV